MTASPTTGIYPLNLLSPLPLAPINFFGCDVIIEDLLGYVERSESVTLVGAGGIGKTAIALTLLHHSRILARFGHHCYFMRCHDLESSLDKFLGRLSDTIGARDLRDMAQLQSHLSTPPRRILVVDGVECILDPLASGAAEITSATEELSRCRNLCLLLTSKMDVRIAGLHRVKVPKLSANSAQDVFYSRCRLERSAEVDNLLTSTHSRLISSPAPRARITGTKRHCWMCGTAGRRVCSRHAAARVWRIISSWPSALRLSRGTGWLH